MRGAIHHPMLDKALSSKVQKFLAMEATAGMVMGRDRFGDLDITFFGPAWDFETLEQARFHHDSNGNTVLSTFEKPSVSRTKVALDLMSGNPGMSMREASRRAGINVMAVSRAVRSADKPRCPHCGSVIHHKPS
jgi:hypothetical protein